MGGMEIWLQIIKTCHSIESSQNRNLSTNSEGQESLLAPSGFPP